MKRILLLILTHAAVGGAGFALGVYLLPILIAPTPPSAATVRDMAAEATFTAEFVRDLQGSDALHWGAGSVAVGPEVVAFEGRLAPGPDYKLYFSPEFVETEAAFNRLKPRMVRAGDVKTFENFVVPLPSGLNPEDFTAVIIWCETFGQFITAAAYR